VSLDDPGGETVAAYDVIAGAFTQTYSEMVPTIAGWLDEVASRVGDGRLLELGSGPGRDADYLQARGVRVTRSDATGAFVGALRGRGLQALRLDVRTDELGGPWDSVLANAVLLHLTTTQFASVLERARAAIPAGGTLAFTLKEGDGEAWAGREPQRWFRYWREEPLRAALRDAGWTPELLERHPGRDHPWLHVIAR
jgi:hypothetical protein